MKRQMVCRLEIGPRHSDWPKEVPLPEPFRLVRVGLSESGDVYFDVIIADSDALPWMKYDICAVPYNEWIDAAWCYEGTALDPGGTEDGSVHIFVRPHVD